jgi:hypothetical protein
MKKKMEKKMEKMTRPGGWSVMKHSTLGGRGKIFRVTTVFLYFFLRF